LDVQFVIFPVGPGREELDRHALGF